MRAATTLTRPGARAPDFLCPVVVGRRDVLAAMEEALQRPAGCVVIEGEAGIGKSRLLAELRSRCSAQDWFVGNSYPLGAPFPFGPLVEALTAGYDAARAAVPSPITGVLRPLIPELASMLPLPPEPLADPAAERHLTFRAIVDLLLAVPSPVLALEDLQWSDEATLEFLTILALRPPQGLRLVVTVRREHDQRPDVMRVLGRLASRMATERVTLGRLDAGAVEEFVSTVLDVEEVSSDFAAFLHDRTGGLPFAMEEVMRMLFDRGDLAVHDGQWMRRAIESLRVPDAVRDTVLERVAALPPDVRDAVQAASVLSRSVHDGVFAGMLDQPLAAARAALSAALSAAILRETPDGYGFQHALARQAVLDSIPQPRRRDLHTRALRALEEAGAAPLHEMVHHARAAGMTTEWIHYAEKAADHACALGDDASAAQTLAAVLEEVPLHGATRHRLTAKLAATALHARQEHRATKIVRACVQDETVDTTARAELQVHLGWLLLQGGESRAAREQIAAAIDRLHGRPALQARALATLGLPTADDPLASQLRWLEDAQVAASRCDDPAVTLAVAVDRASWLTIVGHPQAATAIAALPTTAHEPAQYRQLNRGCLNIAVGLCHRGSYGAAADWVQRGVTLADEMGYERHDTELRSTQLLLDFFTGCPVEDRARALLDESREAGAAVDAMLVIGLSLLQRGQVTAASDMLQDVLARAAEVGVPPVEAAATGALVTIALSRGEPDAALSTGWPMVESLRRRVAWVWSADLVPPVVTALAALQRSDDAHRLVDEVEASLAESEAPAARAGVAHSRAVIALAQQRPAEARTLFDVAVAAWDALPRPVAAAVARGGRGEAALIAGDAAGAQDLRDSVRALRDLNAGWHADHVASLLRDHGFTVAHRRGRRGYGSALSPRERQVAVMAAEGKTNREIAEVLFLSPRTVADHVSRALEKLQVPSRAELPAAMELNP